MTAPNTQNERDYEALRRAQRAHEPSMEEILASIRAIIADDRAPEAARPSPPLRAVANTGPQIVYSNDGPVRASVEPPAAAKALDPTPAPEAANVVWARPRSEVSAVQVDASAAVVASPEEAPSVDEGSPVEEMPSVDTAPLLSDETDRAVAASFSALSTSVALQSSETIERLTREMLRPMIKTWLDENLPTLVERLVRAEIQRVARGGR
jgi:cell pole-organizing protein PopZ